MLRIMARWEKTSDVALNWRPDVGEKNEQLSWMSMWEVEGDEHDYHEQRG